MNTSVKVVMAVAIVLAISACIMVVPNDSDATENTVTLDDGADITDAISGNSQDTDLTIVLKDDCTYTLTSVGFGGSSLTIQGNGAIVKVSNDSGNAAAWVTSSYGGSFSISNVNFQVAEDSTSDSSCIIYFAYFDDAVVTGCNFEKVQLGLTTDASHGAMDATVRNCIWTIPEGMESFLDHYALLLTFLDDVRVSGCEITGYDRGMNIQPEGDDSTACVTGCIFSNIGGKCALQFSGDVGNSNVSFSGCRFTECEVAVSIHESATGEGKILSAGNTYASVNTLLLYSVGNGETSQVGFKSVGDAYEGVDTIISTEDNSIEAPISAIDRSDWYSDLTINDYDDLMEFAQMVNSGNDFSEMEVELGADIQLSSDDWTPIGQGFRDGSTYTVDSTPFRGTFDGNDHTISGLKITTTDGADYALGLFGVVAGGIVQNLNLADVNITNETSECAGAVVGFLCDGGKVSGCTVGSADESETSVISVVRGNGGIVGRLTISGTIENCTNYAHVTATGPNVGGIVGAAYYEPDVSGIIIKGCHNYGIVEGTDAVGGIVGYSVADVSDCHNHVAVNGNGYSVGGIIGEQRHQGSVKGCTNEGAVTNSISSDDEAGYGTGGIVGWIRYIEESEYTVESAIEVDSCNNEGAVTGSGGIGVGGIVGMVFHTVYVTSCSSSADISGGNMVAAIVGGVQTLDDYHTDEFCRLVFSGNNASGSITGTGSNVNAIVGHLTDMDSDQPCTLVRNSRVTAYENTVQISGMESGLGSFDSTAVVNSNGEVYGYNDLSTAIENTMSGDVVVLMKGYDNSISIPSGKSITLDLNGKSITFADDTTNGSGVITNNGSLTIVDSLGGGSVTAEKGIVIYATADSYTEIRGGTFISKEVGPSYSRALSSSGEVLITGGSFVSEGYSGNGDNYTNAIAITNLNNDNQDASLTISPADGSTVTVTSENDYAVSSRYGADVYIHGGSFACEGVRSDVYCFEPGGDFIIYEGTFNHEPYPEYIDDGSFVYFDSGEYSVSPITVIVETPVYTYEELAEALSDLSRPIHVVLAADIEIPADEHLTVGNGFVLDLGNRHLTVEGVLTLDGDIVASEGGYMDVDGFVENVLKLEGISVNGMPGASADGYHVTNAMDLQWLAYNFEYGGSEYFDTIFLDNDISLPDDVTFTPIGTEANPVEGILFDGGGHTISNLHVEPTTEYTGGLFGTIYDSTVMDLTINGSGNNSTSSYIGAVAGYVGGITTFSNITVENFALLSPISFGVGGFVGQIGGEDGDRVEFVSCTLRNVEITGNSNVGSFWGTSTGYPGTVGVYNCILDDVNVTATSVNGGIVAGFGNSAIVDIIALSQTDVSVIENGQPRTSYVAHTTTNPIYDYVDATTFTAIKGSDGWTAVEGDPDIVATVNGSPYTDFETALMDAVGKELVLQTDIQGSFVLPSGATLDLNGHTITGDSDAPAITTPTQPNGNTIIDSSDGMTGRIIATEGQPAISVRWSMEIRGGNIEGDIDVTEGVNLGFFGGFLDGSIICGESEQIRIYGGEFTERPQQEWLSSRYFPLLDEDMGIYTIVEATTVSWDIYTMEGVESGQFVVPLGYSVADFYADQIPVLPEDGADYAYHWIANDIDDWDWSTPVNEDPYVRSLCEYELTISASSIRPYVGQTVTLTVGDNSGLEGLYYYGLWYTYDSNGEPVPLDDESMTFAVTTSGTYGYSMTIRNAEDGYQIGNGLGEITITFRQSGGTVTPDPEPEEETETVTNPDGSTTTTTTRPDGSSTVETNRPDGSSTVIDETPVEGGTQTTVTDTDANGNTTSTTTTVTETTTSAGGTVSSTVVETTDIDGNTTSTTDSIYVSADESTVTNIIVITDADGNTTAQTSTVVSVAPSEEGMATVTSDSISEAVSQIQGATSEADEVQNTITVQPSGDTQQSVTVVMEPEAIQSIVDTGATLEIVGEVGTISASTEVAGTLSQQTSSVSIMIQVADKEQMAPVQQEAVGDRTTYQLLAVTDEGEIHELGGQVTVTVPYELSVGEIESSIEVRYVDDDGQMHTMPTTYENGIVTFTTTHFSYYTIHSEYETPEPEVPQTDDGGEDNTLMYVGIVAVVIVVIAVAAVALRHRF